MNPVNQTILLLVVVLSGATVSTVSWQWLGWHAPLVTYGAALCAGLACGRITRIVRRLAE